MSRTYIEMGDGEFLNADQVISIRTTGGDDFCRVEIYTGRGISRFHGDKLTGEQACKSALVALLKELGKTPDGTGLHVITFLDHAVQSRYLA